MTNLSNKSRKQLVLDALRAAEWVKTAEICAVGVGGSEGTRRLRELRRDGYQIEKRRSPLKGSDQWEYRLVGDPQGAHEWRDESRVPNPPDPRSAAATRSLPFVAWHASATGGMTARFRGHSLSISNWWDHGWTWCATSPDGSQVTGRATDLNTAKRMALEAAL